MTSVLLALALVAPAVIVVPPEGPGSALDLAWVGEAVADRLPLSLARLGVPAVERGERMRAQEALAMPAARLTRATSIRSRKPSGRSA